MAILSTCEGGEAADAIQGGQAAAGAIPSVVPPAARPRRMAERRWVAVPASGMSVSSGGLHFSRFMHIAAWVDQGLCRQKQCR